MAGKASSSSNTDSFNAKDCAENFFKNLNKVDNVTKNIIREIRRECSLKKIRIDEDLVTYFVKLSSLDPQWNLKSHKTMTRIEVQTFIKNSLEILSNESAPLIICLKIQLFFNKTFTSRDQIITNATNKYYNQLKPFENGLIFWDYDATTTTGSELDSFYRKIVMFTALKSGLGNPLHVPVQKETFMALHSIFTMSDIGHFVKTLNNGEKREFLVELTNLVTGIRLFNWKRGVTKGEGINDRMNDLREMIKITSTDLRNTLQTNMRHVYLLTTTLENVFEDDVHDIYYIPKNIDEKYFKPHGNRTIIEGFCPKYVKYVQGLLHITRQCEVYMRKLLEELVTVEKNEKELVANFDECLQKLYDLVERRTTISTTIIFPIFLTMASTWSKFLYERIIVHYIDITLQNLKMCTKNINFEHPVIMKMVHQLPILSDAERIAQMDQYTIPRVNDEIEIIEPFQVSNFGALPLQFLGFCPVQLVETDAALIPGNPNNGVIMWKNMYFAFSSVARAIKFQKHPEVIFKRVLELSRNYLQLIFLFDVYDYLLEYQNVGQIYEIPPQVTIKYNVEVQTETHPVPSNIDKSYHWNVWDLKKEAIVLTNLLKKVTKSAQTYNSNFRLSIQVQTYSPRNTTMNTMQDEGTNVPTLQNYIFGLRGRRDSVQHIIELTRPVNE